MYTMKEVCDQIEKLNESINFIDNKQMFYDDVLAGKINYISNLIREDD